MKDYVVFGVNFFQYIFFEDKHLQYEKLLVVLKWKNDDVKREEMLHKCFVSKLAFWK